MLDPFLCDDLFERPEPPRLKVCKTALYPVDSFPLVLCFPLQRLGEQAGGNCFGILSFPRRLVVEACENFGRQIDREGHEVIPPSLSLALLAIHLEPGRLLCQPSRRKALAAIGDPGDAGTPYI